VGIITTGAKADMVEKEVMDRIYRQMATLNKTARDIMVQFHVHSCTDVTGFAFLGHSYEMAQGSNCTIRVQVDKVPYHAEALELASMGLIPAGAYRNREYAQAGVQVRGNISLAMQDILYDPQTSGGLLFAIPAEEAEACLAQMKQWIPEAAIVGYVTEKEDSYIILE
jgi:selenide,water dikinase